VPLSIVVGAQWGDEGKGKIVDLLASGARVVARYAGGPNAGHTVVAGDRTLVLHTIPSGVLHANVECVIGAGTVVDLEALLSEMAAVEALGINLRGRLLVSDAAHLILPYHRVLEREADLARLGTTGRGIGQAYRDKAARTGVRLGLLRDPGALRATLRDNLARIRPVLSREARDLPETNADWICDRLEEARRIVAPLLGDASARVYDALERGEQVLAEGAQGTLLDIDHGTYPYVTSSSAIAGGAMTGLGIGPRWVREVVGVTKAYTTRVGEGPFPTELPPSESAALRESGNEYGATTGRPRRCGWLDLVALRYAARVNGLTGFVVTKLDVLDGLDELAVCTAYRLRGAEIRDFPADGRTLADCEPVYEAVSGWRTPTTAARAAHDLPAAAHAYLERIAGATGVPVLAVSVGATRDATVWCTGTAASAASR
jgi:adenylosuccinate synthase